MEPQVTVLMSVWNGEAHVAAAVESILAQSYRAFEFLIIDDASADRTPQILRSFADERVRVICNESNLGLTRSLNRGLELARGELIARQDADDWSHPQRIERQVAFLDEHPAVAAVGAQARLVDGSGASLGNKDFPLTHEAICWMHLFDNALAHSAVTFRKAAGAYHEAYTASQDYELWSRLSATQRLANLPERLVTLRVLESSITRTHKRPELIRQIQAQHFQRLFPGRAITDEELALLGQFRTRVEPQSLSRFRAMAREWLTSYCQARPGACATADSRRTIALLQERIGYNLLETDRSAALRELARAIRTWPPRALHLPWMRIAALALLGDSARKVYARVMGRSSS
jgi:glycosyltransferase involved in cell wall biosynthesis